MKIKKISDHCYEFFLTILTNYNTEDIKIAELSRALIYNKAYLHIYPLLTNAKHKSIKFNLDSLSWDDCFEQSKYILKKELYKVKQNIQENLSTVIFVDEVATNELLYK